MSKAQVTVVFDKSTGCTIYELTVNVNGKDFYVREHISQHARWPAVTPPTEYLLNAMRSKLAQNVIESLVRIEA